MGFLIPVCSGLFVVLLTALDDANQGRSLVVPDGFTVRLVAEVPAVEYPSQVATSPDGALFVAEDPMDQRGPYEANDGRILRFADGGNQSKPSVFASGLRAVQGMAWQGEALFVSHMPFLSVFRDRDGDGCAEVRVDLFTDLGPTSNRGLNDHIVSGIQFGMDGWLYISVGDKGVPGTKRPEDGVVIQLQGGGVLRCRPDGRALEVVSSGTRNHLEANLDTFDRIFTYDNTDDGLGWWTRLTHHIDGGYFGYPHDYHDRPDRFLDRMAEYGGGSPCGAVFYREAAWPQAFRGLGLWAEWGKGKVQAFRFRPKGASFEVAETIDFAVADQAADFRPIDLALSHDGRTLFIADWNLGAWGDPRKVGRVWAVSVIDPAPEPPRGQDTDPIPSLIAALDHPAYFERMRAQQALIARGDEALDAVVQELARRTSQEVDPGPGGPHLVWILDALAGGSPEASLLLIETLKSRNNSLKREAARALGQRRVPIAVETLIAALGETNEAEVRLEATIALGRIGDRDAVPELIDHLADADPYMAFATRVALRRIGDWSGIATGLGSENPVVRLNVLGVLEQQFRPEVVSELLAHAVNRSVTAEERATALKFAADLARRPTPWDGTWWGTRPAAGAPPAHVIEWEMTDPILVAIRRDLYNPDIRMRYAAITAIAANEDRASLPDLKARFTSEPDTSNRMAIAGVLGALRDESAVPVLTETIRDANSSVPLREAAIQALDAIGNDAAEAALLALLSDAGLADEHRPRVISAIGKRRMIAAVPNLLDMLSHGDKMVRLTSAAALARAGTAETAGAGLRAAVADPEPEVATAAVAALGDLRDREAVPLLIEVANRDPIRPAATKALAQMPDLRALQVYLRGLSGKNPEERAACAQAVAAIRESAVPGLDRLADRRELSGPLVNELRKVYATPRPLTSWKILGPFARDSSPPFATTLVSIDRSATYPAFKGAMASWTNAEVEGKAGLIDLGSRFGGDRREAYGFTTIERDQPGEVDLVVGSDDTLTLWVNGHEVYDYAGDRGFAPEQGRAKVELQTGINSILIRCGNSGGGWQYAVALADPPDYAFLRGPATGAFDPENFRVYALERTGNADRGRALFADRNGLACVKCHKANGQPDGGDVGPDLTGIGTRYTRHELIDSVLAPSAKIFSGYEPWVVATVDGRVLTGLIRGDDGKTLTLVDADANVLSLPHEQIDERRPADVSLMPSGLAEGLSVEEFADLIAYLTSLQSAEAPPSDSTK